MLPEVMVKPLLPILLPDSRDYSPVPFSSLPHFFNANLSDFKKFVFIKLSVFDDIVSILSQCLPGSVSDPPSFFVSSILHDQNIEKILSLYVCFFFHFSITQYLLGWISKLSRPLNQSIKY